MCCIPRSSSCATDLGQAAEPAAAGGAQQPRRRLRQEGPHAQAQVVQQPPRVACAAAGTADDAHV